MEWKEVIFGHWGTTARQLCRYRRLKPRSWFQGWVEEDQDIERGAKANLGFLTTR